MLSTLLEILLGVLVVFVITAFTGYFVAQEFGYMAVDRSRLRAAAAAGDRGAELALGVTARTSFMLSGAQLGITVTGLVVGYVAEPLIGAGLGELLGVAGVPTAVAVFQDGDIAIRRYGEEANNIVRWTEYPHGGHYAALTVPDVWLNDVREFFRELRAERV